jgi:hypothetical protein
MRYLEFFIGRPGFPMAYMILRKPFSYLRVLGASRVSRDGECALSRAWLSFREGINLDKDLSGTHLCANQRVNCSNGA